MDLNQPLTTDANVVVYIGGKRDGDPVWFPAFKGEVPMRNVELNVRHSYGGDDVTLTPTPSRDPSLTAFTVHWKRAGHVTEDLVEVEVKSKKSRKR